MIYQGVHEENGWLVIDYMATWAYGYDFMLDAAQAIINTDFKDNTMRVGSAQVRGGQEIEHLEEAKSHGLVLRDCESLKEEKGVLLVGGQSSIMGIRMQVAFFNQSNVVKLYSNAKSFFAEHGQQVFDNYMNSIEINAYCRAAERKVLSKKKWD